MDDRDRSVMGTFKDAAKTQAVRECIMKHIEDFNSYMEKCEVYDKTIQCVDGKERRVCPQSVMMLTELFHHFFDYCDEALFVEAVKKNLVAHLMHLMLAFPFNSYLHCHVMETLRRQISRKIESMTRLVFDATELLKMMSEGVVMVREGERCEA